MPTLVSSILADGYREINLIAAGKSPSTTQVTESLRLYNDIISRTYGNDAGENLREWPLGNYGRQASEQIDLTALQIANPPINVRLAATQEAAKTIYLPPSPSDGARVSIVDPHSRLATYNVTLDGNGHTIENAASVTLSTDGLARTWFYRADQGDWVRIADLIDTDNHPFPREFDALFSILLALRLAPRNGRKVSELSIAALQDLQRQFQNRYLQSQDLGINPDLEVGRMSEQSYDRHWDSSTDDFNRGY